MAIINLNDANFTEEVEKSTMPVLVDFWAEWCGPCHAQAPIIEDFANQYDGKIKVGKLEVDQNPSTAQGFMIMSIPTLAIFKDGKIVKTMVGVQGLDVLKSETDKAIK